jgi:hypothetical protein
MGDRVRKVTKKTKKTLPLTSLKFRKSNLVDLTYSLLKKQSQEKQQKKLKLCLHIMRWLSRNSILKRLYNVKTA